MPPKGVGFPDPLSGTLNIDEYSLGSIVETVMVATESLAATKKLAFKTDIAKELPHGLGDEQRLTQVLLNLVGNAIKFTDAGEVRITAGAANGHFELSVTVRAPAYLPKSASTSSRSSGKSTARIRAPRVARGSVSRSPERLSRCTAGASGSSQPRARARLFRWCFPRAPPLREQALRPRPAWRKL